MFDKVTDAGLRLYMNYRSKAETKDAFEDSLKTHRMNRKLAMANSLLQAASRI